MEELTGKNLNVSLYLQNNQFQILYFFKVWILYCPFVSVSDLLDYINPDDELKAKEMLKKQARAKVHPSSGPFLYVVFLL
jgi:hypothetical protein